MTAQPESPPNWPQSLWRATAPDVPANPALVGEVRADVTVIGAGFTGLRAALALAEAGTSVAVLDAGDVGWGASGRNGGQINPMLPHNTPDNLRKVLGPIYFERLVEASLSSADALFDMIRTYGIDCDPRQSGWLRVNHGDKARSDAEANVSAWNTYGAGMTHADGADLVRIAGTQAYVSGVVAPRGGAVHPLKLARGLAAAGQARGVTIYGQSPVISLKNNAGKWTARTQAGAITSDWVVVATNGYSGDLLPGLANSILPLISVQIATDPLPEDVIADILPQGHTISDSRRVIMYARREPDNRMVYGGHGTAGPDGAFRGHDLLIRDAERVFPQLEGVDWRYRWGGRIAFTDDHLPHLHEPRPGLLAGLGYNGRGVAMSNVMGRVMAERILGAAPDSLVFPVTEAKSISFRAIKRLGLGTAVSFMRLMDYLESR